MDNHDIDRFFEDSDLLELIRRQERPPNMIWTFQSGAIPMFIQTQESANRMRMVAFIQEAKKLEREHMNVLLEANYCSALDARYAITDDYVVSVFLHPLRELTLTQFLLGMHQTMSCAETFGTSFSGGTLVFGNSISSAQGGGKVESGIDEIMDDVVNRIRGQNYEL